jgi:hypothetical protein
MITTLKKISKSDWPQASVGWNMQGLLKAILFDSVVTVLVESSDVMLAFRHWYDQASKGVEPKEYTIMPQWQGMMNMIKWKRIEVMERTFNEERDADFVKMRMVAIWEAQNTMEREANERSNPSVFLA